MIPPPRHAAARLILSTASAMIAVTVFSLMAIPFGVAGLTAPAPTPIFLGAGIVTVVIPPTRRLVSRFLEQIPRLASSGSYDSMALGTRLVPESGSQAALRELTELARRSVHSRSATIQSEIGGAESGTRDTVAFRTPVIHRGREIARITVTTPKPLRPAQRRRVEQLASSVGVVVANAVATDRIERRILELNRTIDLIQQRRRYVVEEEAAERERAAAEVLSGARPIFTRLRTTAAAADLDGAAEACDQLIVFLRNFSKAMRETR